MATEDRQTKYSIFLCQNEATLLQQPGWVENRSKAHFSQGIRLRKFGVNWLSGFQVYKPHTSLHLLSHEYCV